MNEGKKLTIQMALFFLVVFVLLGIIVIKEKQNILFLPKIKNSIMNYVSENYSDLNLNKENVTEKNNVFTMKVTNPTNKNHYFYITYSNKKITDTYKTDYFEGKTLLTYLSNKLEKNIQEKTKKNYKVSFDNTLNNYSDKVKERLLKEEINNLKIYTIEKEIATSWNNETIANKITDIMTTLEKEHFTPKNYTITITNLDDITESVRIYNLKTTLINNDTLTIIINDIINNNNTSILKENKITYEYLN